MRKSLTQITQPFAGDPDIGTALKRKRQNDLHR
jgi:hypothetical protein